MRSRFQLYPILQRHRVLSVMENLPRSKHRTSSQLIPIRWLAPPSYVPNINNSKHASHATAAECNCSGAIYTCETLSVVEYWKPFGTTVDARGCDCGGTSFDGNINGAIDILQHCMYVRFPRHIVVNEPFFSPTLSNPIGVFVDFYRTTPAGITFYILRSFFLAQSSFLTIIHPWFRPVFLVHSRTS